LLLAVSGVAFAIGWMDDAKKRGMSNTTISTITISETEDPDLSRNEHRDSFRDAPAPLAVKYLMVHVGGDLEGFYAPQHVQG
jgi:hypothetical protein